MQKENLADIRHKLSIIFKHIQLMHNELRYQAKTYTISENLSIEKKKKKKIQHLFPQFFIFFLLKTNKQKNNKDMLMENEMTSSPSM
jgi:hypothetical protein